MAGTLSGRVVRIVAAPLVSGGLLAAATFGVAGVASATATGEHRGPVHSPSAVTAKSYVPTMSVAAQSPTTLPAAHQVPTKIDLSDASVAHTGPVVPVTMKVGV